MTEDQNLSPDEEADHGERGFRSMEGSPEAQGRERSTEAARLAAVKIPRAEQFGDGLARREPPANVPPDGNDDDPGSGW